MEGDLDLGREAQLGFRRGSNVFLGGRGRGRGSRRAFASPHPSQETGKDGAPNENRTRRRGPRRSAGSARLAGQSYGSASMSVSLCGRGQTLPLLASGFCDQVLDLLFFRVLWIAIQQFFPGGNRARVVLQSLR